MTKKEKKQEKALALARLRAKQPARRASAAGGGGHHTRPDDYDDDPLLAIALAESAALAEDDMMEECKARSLEPQLGFRVCKPRRRCMVCAVYGATFKHPFDPDCPHSACSHRCLDTMCEEWAAVRHELEELDTFLPVIHPPPSSSSSSSSRP
jgi:hypothetical protein